MLRQIAARQAAFASRATLSSATRTIAIRALSQASKGSVVASTRPHIGSVSNTTLRAVSVRRYSPITKDELAKPYEYKDVKKLSQQEKHDGIVIVDVREPDEYAAGHIPTAINIPYNSSPGALGLDPEEFEDTFGFPKPKPEDELVFYCLAGVRSTAAEQLAATFGYQKYVKFSVLSWFTSRKPLYKLLRS